MTLKELIEALERIKEQYGDNIKTVVSIDTDDAYNVASCLDVDIFTNHTGEQMLAFCGSLETALLEEQD